MSKSLDPDQARCFVGPELGPNFLQRISAEDTCNYRVNVHFQAICLIFVVKFSFITQVLNFNP